MDEPSRTELMRRHLRDVGCATTTRLGCLIDRSPAIASALLQRDIRKGRVIRDGEILRWASIEEQRLSSAVGLLRRHGYTVILPSSAGSVQR